MELEESTFLTSGYTTKLQSSRQYGTGTKNRNIDQWKRLKVGGEATTEDEMVGWHYRLNGHEFEQTLGVGDGQGELACCIPWICKESYATKRLN